MQNITIKQSDISQGDYYLIHTRNGAEYDNAYVLAIAEDAILIDCWNEVKDRTDTFEILLKDIIMITGFNDSQTTIQHP